MWRYPVSRAVVTAAAVSSGADWKTPKPSAGIVTPLFNVSVRTMRPRLGARFVR